MQQHENSRGAVGAGPLPSGAGVARPSAGIAGVPPNGVRLSILYAEKGRQKKGGHRDPPLHQPMSFSGDMARWPSESSVDSCRQSTDQRQFKGVVHACDILISRHSGIASNF